MAKFRQIYISFWQNEYIQEEMEPEEKLFYLYLLSGPSSSQIGIYQVSKRQMAFDTGFSNVGVSAITEKKELLSATFKLRTNISDLLKIPPHHR